jgi:hypothetical protein
MTELAIVCLPSVPLCLSDTVPLGELVMKSCATRNESQRLKYKNR